MEDISLIQDLLYMEDVYLIQDLLYMKDVHMIQDLCYIDDVNQRLTKLFSQYLISLFRIFKEKLAKSFLICLFFFLQAQVIMPINCNTLRVFSINKLNHLSLFSIILEVFIALAFIFFSSYSRAPNGASGCLFYASSYVILLLTPMQNFTQNQSPYSLLSFSCQNNLIS